MASRRTLTVPEEPAASASRYPLISAGTTGSAEFWARLPPTRQGLNRSRYVLYELTAGARGPNPGWNLSASPRAGAKTHARLSALFRGCIYKRRAHPARRASRAPAVTRTGTTRDSSIPETGPAAHKGVFSWKMIQSVGSGRGCSRTPGGVSPSVRRGLLSVPL